MFHPVLLGICGVAAVIIWRRLYPKPYPGIPYVEASAHHISGDIPELMTAIQASDEVANSMFAISTQKLKTPLAQVLFPGFRNPLIILDDPHEVEDILVRRQGDFDRSAESVAIFAPIFPNAIISQLTTPKLKAQKHMWAAVMNVGFLRKAAASNIHAAALEMVQLWRLKASAHQDHPFNVLEDLKNATLDAIWVVMLGKDLGVTKFETERFQAEIIDGKIDRQRPKGIFVRDEVAYLDRTIAKNSKKLLPWLAQKLETFTPRYRQCRATVTSEIGRAMKDSVDRYLRLQMEALEDDDSGTCMIDLVLRRQMSEAKKKGITPTNPTTDQNMLDEMFAMLIGANDSTAYTISWFIIFMGLYPDIQKELRTTLTTTFSESTIPSANQILSADIPYLDSVCEESLRLAGTSKGNVREATVDTQILGYRIPKGANVLMSFHVNHDPYPIEESKRSASSRAAREKYASGCYNNPAPSLNIFEPRRWIRNDRQTGRDIFNAYAVPTLAFGGGFRGCFGRKLANMEFRIVVVLLIMSIEFLELPEELRSMEAYEAMFREPKLPFAKIREL